MIQNPQFFATAYNTISACEDLNATERSVLLAIASHMKDQTETVWASIETTLVQMTGLTDRTISRTINGREGHPGLEERGYLSVESRGTDPKTGKRRPNAYALNWALLGLENQADAAIAIEPPDMMSGGTEETTRHSVPGHSKSIEEVREEKLPSNSTNTCAMSQDIVSGGDGLWVRSFPNAVDESSASQRLTIQPGESPMAFLRRSNAQHVAV